MVHALEPATTGRAKCRGCQQKIEKGELRFGERVPNPFGEGEATNWYHVACAAARRPEAFLSVFPEHASLPERDLLRTQAEVGVEHPRLSDVVRAERSPTGRARCRACRELIDKDALRIALERIEDGMSSPSGFVHARCALAYVLGESVTGGSDASVARALSGRFVEPFVRSADAARALAAADLAALERELGVAR